MAGPGAWTPVDGGWPSQSPSRALCPLSASSGTERSPHAPSPRACPHASLTACPCGSGRSGAAGGAVRPVLTARGHRRGHESPATSAPTTCPDPSPDARLGASGPRTQEPPRSGSPLPHPPPSGRSRERARGPACPVLRRDGKGPTGRGGSELLPAWITGSLFSFSLKSFKANISHQKPTTGG